MRVFQELGAGDTRADGVILKNSSHQLVKLFLIVNIVPDFPLSRTGYFRDKAGCTL